MSGTRVRLAALAVVVLLAGCSILGGGSPGTPSGADTPGTPAATVTTSDGGNATNDTKTTGAEFLRFADSSLAVDANRTLERVEGLVGEDVERPTIWVDRSEDAGSNKLKSWFPGAPDAFPSQLALTNVSSGGSAASGVAPTQSRVVLFPDGNRSVSYWERTLAHEFVHIVQLQTDVVPWGYRDSGYDSTDQWNTVRSTFEGSAVWVTDHYIQRYMPANATTQSEGFARVYAEARVGDRYLVAPYHLGAMGVERRLGDPSNLRELFSPPPNTTEQLIHGLTPAEEPIRPVSVTIADNVSWTYWEPDAEPVMGELFIRVAVSKELSLNRSAEAADGWGYDRLLSFERGDQYGFAWVTRWDDPANASEFDGAFDTYADRRSTPANLTFRTQRVSDEVVVVYSGPPAFVDAVSASWSDGTVRLRVAD